MESYEPTISEEIVARGLAAMIFRNEEICIKELQQSGYPNQTLCYVRKIVSNSYECGYYSHINPDQIFCNGWKNECTCTDKDNDNNNNSRTSISRWELDCKTCGTPGTCYYCALNYQDVCQNNIWCSDCKVVRPEKPSPWSTLPINSKAEVPDSMLGSDSE